MKRTKTIAIIGAGISGLTAAGYLSRNGFNVKLFEANDKAGGCCANTIINGYSFNDGAIYLALPEVLDYAFEKLSLNRPKLLPLRKITANSTTILPDGTTISFGEGLDITIRSSKRQINTRMLQQELNNLLMKWEPVVNIFTKDLILHPFSFLRLITKGWRHLPKLRGSVASELNKLFSDESVRSAMSGVLLYAGLPPDKMPVISILALASLFTKGLYLPEGGMGKITEVLSRAIKDNGAEIFLNSPVNRIVIKNGHVDRLEIKGHEPFEVDAVISTVSGMQTFSSLLHSNDIPVKMIKKVKASPLAHKSCVIQIGLANKIDARSHLYNIIPMMDKQYELFQMPENRLKWLVYTVPTVTMPELASNGGSIIEMYPTINQNFPVDEWNEDEKEKVFESAVQILSQWYDLNIAAKRIISPKEFRDKLHLYKGAVYGLSPVADPGKQFQNISSIRGLYLAGQTTYPGYGVGSAAVSGIFAAEALIKNLNS